jgi:multidrug efflux pump
MPSGGFSGMVTKPWSERDRTTMQILQEDGWKFGTIPGVRVLTFSPAPLPGGSDFPIEFMITTTRDQHELLPIANQLVQRGFQSGLFMFVDSDIKVDLPQTEIVIDRDKIAMLGLNMAQIATDLSAILGGNYVNRFSMEGRSYKVIPQAKRSERLHPEQLKDLHVSGPNGNLIPLSSFATLKNTVEPRQLNRFQQLNAVKIYGLLVPGVSVDRGLRFLEQEAKTILPSGFGYDYAGESRQLRTEGSTFLPTLLLAALIIYLVLAAQFENFRDPFVILLGSAPLALAGALVFVFFGVNHSTLNIYTQVGLITLVGLIAKNGILIVEFANHLMESGLNKKEAVLEAAATRLRPVLMTTVATVVGHMPLVFVTGAGAAARNNIGIVLVTGMTIGTIFTLFIVPSIYLLLASPKKKHSITEETVNAPASVEKATA